MILAVAPYSWGTIALSLKEGLPPEVRDDAITLGMSCLTTGCFTSTLSEEYTGRPTVGADKAIKCEWPLVLDEHGRVGTLTAVIKVEGADEDFIKGAFEERVQPHLEAGGIHPLNITILRIGLPGPAMSSDALGDDFLSSVGFGRPGHLGFFVDRS